MSKLPQLKVVKFNDENEYSFVVKPNFDGNNLNIKVPLELVDNVSPVEEIQNGKYAYFKYDVENKYRLGRFTNLKGTTSFSVIDTKTDKKFLYSGDIYTPNDDDTLKKLIVLSHMAKNDKINNNVEQKLWGGNRKSKKSKKTKKGKRSRKARKSRRKSNRRRGRR